MVLKCSEHFMIYFEVYVKGEPYANKVIGDQGGNWRVGWEVLKRASSLLHTHCLWKCDSKVNGPSTSLEWKFIANE